MYMVCSKDFFFFLHIISSTICWKTIYPMSFVGTFLKKYTDSHMCGSVSWLSPLFHKRRSALLKAKNIQSTLLEGGRDQQTESYRHVVLILDYCRINPLCPNIFLPSRFIGSLWLRIEAFFVSPSKWSQNIFDR